MEIKDKKCSSKDHKNIDAVAYCELCKIYMCKNCSEYHKEVLSKHHSLYLDRNIKEIFTGICPEEKHSNELEYFCYTHNQLCCIACITKIKGEGKGQHTDCNVCFIKDIEDKKRKILKNNIKYLEKLSIEQSMNDTKKIIDLLKYNKESLKTKIQKIFTKIRNEINKREDKLLLKVDQLYEQIFLKKDKIKEIEKLPERIKISLEKGKLTEEKWGEKNSKLNSLINNCIFIENNIKDIGILNEGIEKYNNNKKKKIDFNPDNYGIMKFLEKIQNFGEVYANDFKYKLKKCPLNICENRIYTITGDKDNIFTKKGSSCQFIGTICEEELEKYKIHKWKVNILNSQNKIIMVGVTSTDFDINSTSYITCGWYFYCYNSTLYSGKPQNYNNKKTDLNKVKYQIDIVMDMNKGTLKFIVDDEDKGDSYQDIPLDKPLVPVILLYDKNDSVEIVEC